jgi:hypothetical protein
VARKPEANTAGYSEKPEESKRGFKDSQEAEVKDCLGQDTRVSASKFLYSKVLLTFSLEQAIHPECPGKCALPNHRYRRLLAHSNELTQQDL